MTPTVCPGETCRHYVHHRDLWKVDKDTGEFYKVPNAWHCHSPKARETHKPNRKTGGVAIGRVCWDCKGTWFEPRAST